MSRPITSPSGQFSLRRRLVVSFGILLILFLGLAGFVLDRAFKESVAAAVEERLQLQIYALLGVAEPEDDGFFLPDLEEARFSQIDSGLYGFILDNSGRELWRSPSALNINLNSIEVISQGIEPGQTFFGEMENERLGSMSYASYGTFWPNRDEEFSFVVMESVEPTAAEIRSFQSSLWFWLGGLAGLLSVIQYFLLRWGLSPLRLLADEVSSVEAGESDQLEGHYPSELQAVSHNLNLLIKSERQRQGRYQTTLGDLAHSLKTPLAVISGMVQQGQTGIDRQGMAEIEEQLERMNQIVSYQLKRAVKAHDSRVLPRPVMIKPVFEKILAALSKVYSDKGVSVHTRLQENARFTGDESDLMEMAGNLIDNAYKYCRQEVEVVVRQEENKLIIEIDDDGSGIAEEHSQWVLERGARADTLKSGQGIGLAVAVDIISSYRGEIRVGKSEIGGASIQVVFEN